MLPDLAVEVLCVHIPEQEVAIPDFEKIDRFAGDIRARAQQYVKLGRKAIGRVRLAKSATGSTISV